MKAVFNAFGYEHRSDNVVDAYILARISFAIFVIQETGEINLTVNQSQVVQSVLQETPDVKKKA
ncbi:hypothetical protein ABER02_10835 [Rossellomorea marisflavi]|uniref:hypothetical protein n=1 Tax=Rossellomorea marisflavi TaxID=189381 RepID=UPI003D2ACD11